MVTGYSMIGLVSHNRIQPLASVAQVRALKVEASHHRHLFSPDTDQDSELRRKGVTH